MYLRSHFGQKRSTDNSTCWSINKKQTLWHIQLLLLLQLSEAAPLQFLAPFIQELLLVKYFRDTGKQCFDYIWWFKVNKLLHIDKCLYYCDALQGREAYSWRMFFIYILDYWNATAKMSDTLDDWFVNCFSQLLKHKLENVSAYIPTNVISISWWSNFSRNGILFYRGIRPANKSWVIC